MNLVKEPWIPVIDIQKTPKKISLQDIFTPSTTILDLNVRPQERIALMRFFICIAHAALDGPKAIEDWNALAHTLPNAAKKYLAQWEDHFELFHPTKPFLQIADLKPAKNDSYVPINKLDFALAGGSNSTLFDHVGEERFLTEDEMALALLVIQNFSTCGLLGQPLWNGIQTAKSANDAPCVTSSMYHVFLTGKTLFDSICLNICTHEMLSLLYNTENWLGRPIWEKSPKSNKDDTATTTFLGRLTPLSRAVKLFKNSNKILYGEALKYPSFPDYPREFNTSLASKKSKKDSKETLKKESKDETYLVGIRTGIQPFRELAAITQFSFKDTNTQALNLNNPSENALEIWVGGVHRNPGKQDILNTLESRFHLSPAFLTENGHRHYVDEIKNANFLEWRIKEAASEYASEMGIDKSASISTKAIDLFWGTVESKIALLFEAIEILGISEESEIKNKEWENTVFRAETIAIELACPQETGRQIIAFAKAKAKIFNKK